ncbi:MAG: ribosome biogenesis GTPase Der [Planctomycetes bacterium]|nr:ribosome biogenesis GTPase Der [Planctomycetota bacterium]
MALPVVAIVGRPNVGKSSLLAFLTRRMVSIVEPTAGVTRDRVSAIWDIDGAFLELVDTGGYGIEDSDDLTEDIERQIRLAIEQASVILFICNARDGVVPLDEEVARLLRPKHDRVLLLANKLDEPRLDHEAGELTRLGFGEAICISARHYRGRSELEAAIMHRLGDEIGEKPADPVMKLAIVGRRNTGKSTFINALAGEERVIVSEIPGTTRDAIDVRFELDGRVFLAIDTAGVQKRSRLSDAIEYYGYTRVGDSIRRADVALLFLDSTVALTDVDKKLAALITGEYKPCVIVINKWDLAKHRAATGEYGEYFNKTLPQLDYAPIVFVSAIDGHNVMAAVETAWSLYKQGQERVGTGRLNSVLAEVTALRGPTARRGRRSPKIYYGTQVSCSPPTVVMFVNNPALIDRNYERFLLNRLRECLPFGEIPIRLTFRARRGGSRRSPDTVPG